ncbi:MAG: hypothetical protein V1929_01265 [bacterium]
MKTMRLHSAALSLVTALVLASGCATAPTGDPGALDMPTGVAVSQDGLREATLSWTPPADGSVRYRIERSEALDGAYRNAGEALPARGGFTDRGTQDEPLADTTAYYYRLVAIAASGAESIPSEIVKTVTAPPPEPPTELQAVAPKSRGVKLAWTPSLSQGVVKYRIERTQAATPDTYQFVAEVTSAEYMDGGTAASTLADSTLYLYRVTAINRVSSVGAPCEPVEVTTLPPPEAPANVQAGSREVRCIPLTWGASPEEDVIRYDVYRSLSKKGPFELIGSVTDRNRPEFLDGRTDPGNLEDDGTYHYRIRAINDVTAESADSEVASATTREVPPRVDGVKVQVRQPREVPMTWKESPDEKVLGYEIWRAEGDSEFALVGRVGGHPITTFVDRGGFKQVPDVSQLKDDTVYNYKIVAFNTAYARSSASEPQASQTKASPAQPTGLDATTELPRVINLTWPANSETDIVAYVVDTSSDGNDFRRLTVVPATMNDHSPLHAREDGLADGTGRRYRVRAIDKDRLVSEWSETIKGQAKPIPNAPRGLKQEPTDAGVRVSWDPPEQADIKAYKLYTKTVFSSEPYAVTEVPEFVVEWPMLKTQLKLMIASIDADNLESQRSEVITVSPR